MWRVPPALAIIRYALPRVDFDFLLESRATATNNFMAIKFLANISKANAQLQAGHEAIDPALASAKISTLKVDGKDVPASEAPLSVKIAALANLTAAGEKSQDVSELIATNGHIAAKVETLEGDLATAQGLVASQTQKISALEGQLATASATVDRQTASGAQDGMLLKASNGEVSRLTKEIAAVNTDLSKLCLEYGCLDLTTVDGKLLAKDAAEDVKLEAANRVPIADKLKASKGAVNAAMRNLGLNTNQLPAGGSATNAPEKKEVKGRDRMKAAIKIEGHTV